MPRESRITYDPKLSVAANAKKCGVTEDAIRYYIRTRSIDRRYEGKMKVLEELRAYIEEHPNATRAELSKATEHGINTIRRYWLAAHGTGEIQPSKDPNKAEELATKRHIAYLDKLPVEFIKKYLSQRESEAVTSVKCDIIKPQPVSVKVPLTAKDLSSEE